MTWVFCELDLIGGVAETYPKGDVMLGFVKAALCVFQFKGSRDRSLARKQKAAD